MLEIDRSFMTGSTYMASWRATVAGTLTVTEIRNSNRPNVNVHV